MTGPPSPDLPPLLERHRELILALLRRDGRGLRRYETEEDLLQGLHLHLLGAADGFEYRGEDAFVGWVRAAARQHVARRYQYWKAQRRRATGVLRISAGRGSSVDSRGVDPAADLTGASTIADRKERILLAMRALRSLPERDRTLVADLTDGLSIDDTARRLGIGYEAAAKARNRAMERFRRTLEALIVAG